MHKKREKPQRLFSQGRGDRTRTCDSLVPNQERYQLRYTSFCKSQEEALPVLRVQRYELFLSPANFERLFNNILLFKYLSEYLHASFHLFFGMSGH